MPVAKLSALPYVRRGVTEGKSANATYKEYQSTAKGDGLQGMRRQDFLRLFSEVLNSRAGVLDAINAPKDQVAGGLSIPIRHTVTARGYGHWVGIHQRTVGESDYIFTPFLVKSHEPMTPAQAEQRAMEYLDQAPDVYNRTTIGVSYMGAEQFQPAQR